MKVSAQVQKRVKDKLAECITLAEKKYNQTFTMPTISYKLRGCTAGKALPGQWTVKFNAQLLMENLDDFIDRTVPHELAHLITDRIYPEAHQGGITFGYGRIRRKKRNPHGSEWQSVMRALGVQDVTRCHSYDVSNARVKNKKRVEYKCTGCGFILGMGPKAHKREQQYPGTYWHKGCKGFKLVLKAAATVTPAAPVQSITPQPAPAGTKQERAYVLYKASPTSPRTEMISLFMSRLNMTRAGATTYYYNCQKKG